jgi:hypothetical protein
MNWRRLFRRRAQPMTCADAGRVGYHTRRQLERDKIRAATIALAEQIGRPELAERLR